MRVRVSVASLMACALSAQALAQAQTRNVVLIVSDGLRWQEIFEGADSSLMNESRGGIWEDSATLWRKYWRPDVADRRKALLTGKIRPTGKMRMLLRAHKLFA